METQIGMTPRTPMTIRQVIASEHYGLLEEIEHVFSDKELEKDMIAEPERLTGYKYILD